jgi:hypothetical protein
MPPPKPHWTEIVKNIVEVLALGVGAVWAYFNFSVKDKPTLAIREKVTSTLKWERSEPAKFTHAEFYVTLENTGTTRFEVTKVKLYARTFDEIGLDSNREIQYFDFNYIKANSHSIYEGTIDNNAQRPAGADAPFIGPYAEGAVWNENFEFLMKANPRKMVLFYIEFYEAGEKEPFEWTYHWDYIGGVNSSDSECNHLSLPHRKEGRF